MSVVVREPHLDHLILCLEEERAGYIVLCTPSSYTRNAITFTDPWREVISIALFFYDYVLTFGDELTHIWRDGRVAVGSVLFVLARYLGATSCILSGVKTTLVISNVITCVRVAAIITSEAILAIRTWAVWGRSKWMFGVLTFFAMVAIIAAGITVGKDVSSTSLDSMSDHKHCLVAKSTVGDGWVIPLMMTIMYEIVTISLTLARIIWWRRRIPPARRVPLLDTLWKDGVIYFALMLGMGSINTGLVITSTASIIRQNVTQLQTALHSMLSTRIVLHLANSGLGVKNLHTTMTTTTSPSSQFPDDMQPQFTSVIRSDYELSTLGTARIGNV